MLGLRAYAAFSLVAALGCSGSSAAGIGPDADGGAPEAAADGAAGAPLPDGAVACPAAGRGPQMIAGAGYCIDATEVTQAQYAAFLQGTNGDTSKQPSVCAFNTSFVPSDVCAYDPTGRANTPVLGVDWCDAFAFCAWAGKHLCGAIGGGALTVAPDFDGKRAEWYAACTNGGDGSHAYPYGNAYDPAKCNGYDQRPDPQSAVADVKTYAACVGGLGGLYDMSGNVWEWEDACSPATGGETAMCNRRGASYRSPTADQMSCKAWQLTPRNTRACDIGFRCCAGGAP